MRFKELILGLAAMAVLCSQADRSVAAELTRQGDSVFVRGKIEAGDLENLDIIGARRIVFEHSLGGTYAGALHYIAVIKKNNLDTVAKEKCFSACALAFLAGKQRSIGVNNGITAISFHSSRIIVDGVPREYKNKEPLIAEVVELTGGRMKPDLLELMRKSWTDASGVVFVAYSLLGFVHFKTLYCDGSQGIDTSKCESLANADPYDMGVLTRR